MSRTLFENSKAALAFAGMTLLGAITMVGTSENDGVLPRMADTIAEQRAADAANWAASPEQQSANAPASNTPSPSTVFGDYDPAKGELQSPEAAAASLAQAEAAAAAGAAAVNTPTARPIDDSMNAY